MNDSLQTQVPAMPSEDECKWALDTLDRIADLSKLQADLSEDADRELAERASRIQYLLQTHVLDWYKMIRRREERKNSSNEESPA